MRSNAIDKQSTTWTTSGPSILSLFINIFASAGSDATVSIWDHTDKKRLRQYPKFPGVAAVGFNCDGSRIAVGVSSTWDEGEGGFKVHPVIP